MVLSYWDGKILLYRLQLNSTARVSLAVGVGGEVKVTENALQTPRRVPKVFGSLVRRDSLACRMREDLQALLHLVAASFNGVE